jgi:hypothetical protein
MAFHNKLVFYGERLTTRPTPKLKDHPCRLSAAAYSVYSQLPSIARGHLSIHHPRTRLAVVTRGPI